MTFELPKHNLSHLYKYASAETAMRVIRTQTFRWSSPTKFNDPFDHQTGFIFKFSGDDLAHALEVVAEKAIFGDTIFDPPYRTNYGQALRRMRSIKSKLPRSEVMADLRQAGKEIADNFQNNCRQLNSEIISFLTHSRVLCLAEAHDNVVMWSHYANEHRGVVFKLRRLEELDHRLLVAQKVNYTDEPLIYMSIDEYVDNLTGNAYYDPNPRIWKIAYRKHSDWAYEREWRLHIPLLSESEGDGYSYYDEPKELFEAIYFGCRMQPEDVNHMTELIRENLPETSIFQARKSIDRFRLDFFRIS